MGAASVLPVAALAGPAAGTMALLKSRSFTICRSGKVLNNPHSALLFLSLVAGQKGL